jgi:hypothetical protein
MGSVSEGEPAKTDTAEMMLKNLGLDDQVDEPDGLPDWLSDTDEDTGDIAVDIFAASAADDKGTKEVDIKDTSDSWVQAFQQEASGELEEWYEDSVAQIDGDEVPAALSQTAPRPTPDPVAATVAGGLQSADLPIETTLPQGQAMAVPDWLSDEEPEPVPATTATHISSEMPSIEAMAVEDMDWLSTDESEFIEGDMPDWLKEQVDDSVTAGEQLPDWLADGELNIESVEEIPDV